MFLLKHSFSNLRRNGLYSCIHLVGLSVSLTAVFFIFLWVRDELSTDRYHQQIADTYLLVEHETYYDTDSYSEYVPRPLVQAAKEQIPEIKEACAVRTNRSISFLEYEELKFFDNRILNVDTTLFRIFDFTFLEGDPQYAFLDQSSVVLTEQLSKKLFGEVPAYGKLVKAVSSDGSALIRQVSAVVATPKKHSMLVFDALLPSAPDYLPNAWYNWSYYGFLLLYPGADVAQVGVKIAEANSERYNEGEGIEPFLLFPLSQYHLYHFTGTGGRIVVVRLFMLMGLVLLLMACVNYVNLVTARAQKRHREIAIKKLVGATRWKLIQLLGSEVTLLFLIALLLSILCLYLCLPLYTILTGSALFLSLLDPNLWLMIFSIFVVISLFAGLYPVLLLSSFKPLGLIQKLAQRSGRLSLRTLLVVFQFCCSTVFIVAMLGMRAQFRYMQTNNLGNRTEDIFTVEYDRSLQISSHIDSFLSDLKSESTIAGVALSLQHIMSQDDSTDGVEWEGMRPESNALTTLLIVNTDFPELMGLEFVLGRGFTGTPADSSRIILNETAVKRMGIEEPIGKRFYLWRYEFQIAGVVKDFHFNHMKEAIEPLIMFISDWDMSVLYVKTQPNQHVEALAAVERAWRQYDTDYPFNARFMSDTFADIYREDKQMTRLFNLFSALAVLISCLGLFGLVTFTAETRTKEIGIRKVMGARVGQMVYMLCKEFILLTGIAMVIAFPIAYYWLNRMLQEYAYRINMSWLMFALAALITVGITLFTVSWQAIRAATANPVDSVKMV